MKRGLTETCYRFFSTLASPTRLAIMEELRSRPMNVTALVETLGQEQSMISHNLRPLEQCALVYSQRRGKERIYSLNIETMEKIFKTVENHAERFCPPKRKCASSK